MSTRRSAILVSAPPAYLHRQAGRTVGYSAERVASRVLQEGHPLTSFPPLQSSHACHRCCARKRCRQRLAFDESALRHVTSSLRPAARSPDSSSLEVLFPFSAINAVSPFLDATNRDCSPYAQRRPRVCHTHDISASRVSHPPGGFLLTAPRQSVSPGRHSWGSEPVRTRLLTKRAARRRRDHRPGAPVASEPAVGVPEP